MLSYSRLIQADKNWRTLFVLLDLSFNIIYNKYDCNYGKGSIQWSLKEIMDTAISVGYHLMKNGAEVYRVEQSITYICRAYGLCDIHVFAIPSSIVVTISDNEHKLTETKRVLSSDTDLEMVARLTNLSRYICENKPDYRTVKDMLKEVLNGPKYTLFTRYAGGMLIGFSFALFFGGNFFDSLVALVIGGVITFLMNFLARTDASSFFINIICGCCSGIIAYAVSAVNPSFHSDKIIIGVIMILVPGLAIANSMRDFIMSDTVAGLSRLQTPCLLLLE